LNAEGPLPMDIMNDSITLSRLQFALTTIFHIIWPLLSIGLSIFLVFMEAMWLKTREIAYYHHVRFWSKLFALNFAVGVVSGIPLEFQFGANWERFSTSTGGFFGAILGFEGAMAFMLEAAFLYIMLFGWKRVPRGLHLLSTCMVALGASLSAFWILVANSWMQTPAGGHFENGVFVLTDFWEAVFNPDLPWGFSHMWVACLETTLFAVGGVSAWYILRRRNVEFFTRSFKVAVVAAILLTPFQIWLGDGSGVTVARHQPAKLGALEAHWRTNPPGQGAPWSLLAWPNRDKQENDWTFLNIPDGLSLLLTRSFDGEVKGLSEFPREDQPPIVIPYYAFRIMVAIGFGLFFLMLWTLWVWRKGGLRTDRITGQKWLLWAWIGSIPSAYIAVETGWVTREVGRLPWIIYGHMRVEDAASNLPVSTVAASLAAYFIVYSLLFVIFLYFARRILKKGPDLSQDPLVDRPFKRS